MSSLRQVPASLDKNSQQAQAVWRLSRVHTAQSARASRSSSIRLHKLVSEDDPICVQLQPGGLDSSPSAEWPSYPSRHFVRSGCRGYSHHSSVAISTGARFLSSWSNRLQRFRLERSSASALVANVLSSRRIPTWTTKQHSTTAPPLHRVALRAPLATLPYATNPFTYAALEPARRATMTGAERGRVALLFPPKVSGRVPGRAWVSPRASVSTVERLSRHAARLPMIPFMSSYRRCGAAAAERASAETPVALCTRLAVQTHAAAFNPSLPSTTLTVAYLHKAFVHLDDFRAPSHHVTLPPIHPLTGWRFVVALGGLHCTAALLPSVVGGWCCDPRFEQHILVASLES
uniref:Uncharacterized protein n=1 Tax=Mycena chlorophos TaxID=658473 RepID=A0ABQ0LDP8_MYCCL|nr:predicted protein [Mycena chlorophos]